MKIQEFDYKVDILQTLLWQYDQALKLQSLLFSKQIFYDFQYSAFWEDWFNDVFNLITADEFGLHVWAIILNLPLSIGVDPDKIGKPIWGTNVFNAPDPSAIQGGRNFENGSFTTSGSQSQLTIDEQRLVLRLRYYQLVSAGSLTQTNTFLAYLFKDLGEVYALDGLDMSITYVFNFNVSQQLLYILSTYDILPRPAGVKIKYYIKSDSIFGFNEVPMINDNMNFQNGNFISEFILGLGE